MAFQNVLGHFCRVHGMNYKNSSTPIRCPFCNENHLYVDDSKGVVKCWTDGCIKGGALDFVMEYYREIEFRDVPDRKEALKILKEDLGITVMPEPKEEIKKTLSEKTRNKVNRALLKVLPLEKADLNELIRRGYSEEEAYKYGYRTLPKAKVDRRNYTYQLLKLVKNLNNFPGFETDYSGDPIIADFGFYARKKAFGYRDKKDEEFFNYLVPVYNLHGQIIFFQIAWDKRLSGMANERKYAKYTVFSTPNRKGGGKVNADSGYVGEYNVTPDKQIIPKIEGKEILVTEGTLKAPLYYTLRLKEGIKEPILSVTGVNNVNAIKKALIELKEICPNIDTVVDCFDMDKFSNLDVNKASKKLMCISHELGFRYSLRKWGKGKGIDDFEYLKLKKLGII